MITPTGFSGTGFRRAKASTMSPIERCRRYTIYSTEDPASAWAGSVSGRSTITSRCTCFEGSPYIFYPAFCALVLVSVVLIVVVMFPERYFLSKAFDFICQTGYVGGEIEKLYKHQGNNDNEDEVAR